MVQVQVRIYFFHMDLSSLLINLLETKPWALWTYIPVAWGGPAAGPRPRCEKHCCKVSEIKGAGPQYLLGMTLRRKDAFCPFLDSHFATESFLAWTLWSSLMSLRCPLPSPAAPVRVQGLVFCVALSKGQRKGGEDDGCPVVEDVSFFPHSLLFSLYVFPSSFFSFSSLPPSLLSLPPFLFLNEYIWATSKDDWI